MTRLGKRCSDCQGTGSIPANDGDPTPQPCVPCEGTGYEAWGDVDVSDLNTKLDAIDIKLDTLETHLDTIEAKIDALE